MSAAELTIACKIGCCDYFLIVSSYSRLGYFFSFSLWDTFQSVFHESYESYVTNRPNKEQKHVCYCKSTRIYITNPTMAAQHEDNSNETRHSTGRTIFSLLEM